MSGKDALLGAIGGAALTAFFFLVKKPAGTGGSAGNGTTDGITVFCKKDKGKY